MGIAEGFWNCKLDPRDTCPITRTNFPILDKNNHQLGTKYINMSFSFKKSNISLINSKTNKSTFSIYIIYFIISVTLENHNS